jgi:hypothetical protein
MDVHAAMKTKILVAIILALAIVGVALADRLLGEPASPPKAKRVAIQSEDAQIRAVIDTVLHRFGVDRREVKSWRVQPSGTGWSRLEERVTVSPAFVSLAFNHELNMRLASLGVHVVGTERTKENVVALHIVKDGTTIRTLSFVTEAKL